MYKEVKRFETYVEAEDFIRNQTYKDCNSIGITDSKLINLIIRDYPLYTYIPDNTFDDVGGLMENYGYIVYKRES